MADSPTPLSAIASKAGVRSLSQRQRCALYGHTWDRRCGVYGCKACPVEKCRLCGEPPVTPGAASMIQWAVEQPHPWGCHACFGKGFVVQKAGWAIYPEYGYWYPRQVACSHCQGTGKQSCHE